MSDEWGFETRQIHVGGDPDASTGARAVTIYQTTAYEFRDSAHAQNLFALAEISYMTYHLDWTVFLFAHTISEVLDLIAFVLVFVAATSGVRSLRSEAQGA